MNREWKAKTMVVGGIAAFVIAIIILLLFVLPAGQKGSPSVQAQPAPGGGPADYHMPPGMGAPPEAMAGGPMAAPSLASVPKDPLEPSRVNPFGAPGGEIAIGRIQALATRAIRYGPDWSRIPITTRVGFVRPERAPRPAPPGPPPPTEKKFLRISSIMWLWMEGSPTATYETVDGKSGSIQPGDWVEDWQVIEIGQDYVVVKNQATGELQRVFLRGK